MCKNIVCKLYPASRLLRYRVLSGTQLRNYTILCVIASFCVLNTNSVNLLFRSPDTVFYDAPRFVTHIDDPAIAALTKYYSQVFPPSNTPGIAILDMCSSWVSNC